MLLRFTTENYASIHAEQELSAVALGSYDDIALWEIPHSNNFALPVVGVFGANASGKSNVMKALQFVSNAVLFSMERWRTRNAIPRNAFKLDEASPSKFIIEFIGEGTRYEYGFTCDSDEFLSEWLYSFPKGVPRRLFVRERGKGMVFSAKLTGPKKQIEKIMRGNSLYLSAAMASEYEPLRPVYKWFECLRVAVDSNFDARMEETRYWVDEHASKAIPNLIRYADLGVTNLIFTEVPYPPEQAEQVLQVMRILGDGPEEISVDDLKQVEVELDHTAGGDSSFRLPLRLESSGTRTWIGILGAIVSTLKSGTVLVVDELDARLHHHLTAQFVRLFQEPATNPHGAQLIFNSHDAALLSPASPANLRPDQVWIAEKVAGVTTLNSLIDFDIGDEDNIEARYLNGRFGGTPFFDEELMSIVIAEVTEQ